jgi:hypothetical protein
MDQNFFVTPFASLGDKTSFPIVTDPGGSITFQQGWGPDYQADQTTDPNAKDIDRANTNYLFYIITQAIAALQSTGIPEWITPANNNGVAFSYAKYAQVRYSATVPGVTFETYVSTKDANTSVPGANADWQPIASIVAAGADVVAGTSSRLIVTPLSLQSYPGNAAQAFDVGTAVNPTQAPRLSQLTAAVLSAGGSVGQCRLSVTNGTTLTLAPYDGNQINVNGALVTIPAAGVTLSNSGLQGVVSTASYSVTSNVATFVTQTAHGLSVGSRVYMENTQLASNGSWIVTAVGSPTQFSFAFTHANVSSTADTGGSAQPVFYAYAAIVSGSLALVASQVGYLKQANGITTQNGDATKTLVGMFALNGAGQFVDSAAQRWCINWFNRRNRRAISAAGGPVNFSSQGTPTVISSIWVVRSLVWADDVAQGEFVGTMTLQSGGPAASQFNYQLVVDSSNVGLGPATSISANATYNQTMTQIGNLDATVVPTGSQFEGAHAVFPTGQVGPNGGTFTINNLQISMTAQG